MQYSLPVASSNATCLPEIYGGAARYFDPLDPQDMAQKINEVLTDQALASKLIDKGHACLRKYSWKDMARKTLIQYGAILHTEK
jgi:glycosyltransferase involved in cell wall biosynthesis